MAWMAKFIRQGQYDYRLRALAEKVIGGLWPHDYLSEYAAILHWVQTNIRYSRDPRTIEQVKTPAVIIETKTGDCDDLSVVVGALVGLVGAKVRLVAGSFVQRGPLAHVWLEAFDPNSGAWVVLDPVPGRKVGQMLRRLRRTLVKEVLQ
jgi:transglutaminase-like putative cysteine protease